MEDSPRNDDEPSVPSSSEPAHHDHNLIVEVDDWFLPEMAKLKQDAFAMALLTRFEGKLTVKVKNPQFLELQAFIQTQVHNGDDARIATEQRQALDVAKSELEATEKWAAILLVQVTRHYGLRLALRSFEFFLRQRLIKIIGDLARYQVATGDVACAEFAAWFKRHDDFATLAQFVYGCSQMLEVIVGDDPSQTDQPASDTVYLPLARVANSGFGDLYINLRESAVYLPTDLWIDYVVPQLTARKASDSRSYHAWTPEQGSYLTEGMCWLGDQRLELNGHHIDGTDVLVVQRDSWEPPDPSIKARQYLECVIDPPAQHSGPFHFFTRDTDLELMKALGDEVVQSITAVDERTWRAPSAWHTAAWLLNNTAGVAEGKEILSSYPGNSPTVKFHGPLLFRGGVNSESDLQLTLSLKTADEYSALVRFMMALNSLNGKAEKTGLPPLIIDSIVGVAAHYGLATYLLSMTLDPLIAILESSNLAANGEEAAVYWIPLAKIKTLGGRMIIPPIWAESLYDQKEVFLDFKDVGLTEIKSESWKLLFPVDKSYLDFEFPKQQVGPPHDEVWLKSAKTWAFESQTKITRDVKGNADELAAELCSRLGEPSFVKTPGQPARMEQWSIRLANLLKWLMLKRNEREFYFDCSAVRSSSPYTYGTWKWFARFTEEQQTASSLSPEYQANEVRSVGNAVRTCLAHLENSVNRRS